MKNDLTRIGVDPMSSMASGGNTSLFTGSGVTYGCSPYAQQLVPPGPMPDPSALASQVIGMVINDVTQFAASYLGEKIGDLLSPPSMGDVMGAAAAELMANMPTPKDIQNEILSTMDSVKANLQKDAIGSALSLLGKDINEKVGKVKDKVYGTLDKVKEKVAPITSYIFMGPAWVETQANAIDKMACDEIEELVGTQFNKLQEKKKAFVQGLGASVAKQQASEAKNKMLEAASDMIKMKDKQVSKAKNLATSKIKEALLNVKAMTGQ